MALFSHLCVNLRDFLCGVPKSTPPRNPLISLTLLKPGTRPEGVGLSPGTGRRKLLIYELETSVSTIWNVPNQVGS